jgi:hypothetical protein
VKVVVYARTSGDEADTGQDVRAQAAQEKAACERMGHVVVAGFLDDGVSGSTSAGDRFGWGMAVQAAQAMGAAVAFRDVSRFSRYHPARALMDFEALPVPVLCRGEAAFTTAGREIEPAPVEALVRFALLWKEWMELAGIRGKTQAAMDEIKAGRRPTKSGKPNGRPKVVVSPEHLAACRAVLEAEGLLAAHRHVLKLRGYDDVVDSEAKKKRYVSREAFAAQMGLRPAKNPDPPKTPDDQEGELPAVNGSVVGRSVSAGVVAGVQRVEPVEPVGNGQVAADRGGA